MESIYAALTERALDVRNKSRQHDPSLTRIAVALSGPPGSGKSTIAAEVVCRINAQASHQMAAVLPMDGFHYPRAYLDLLPNSAEAHTRRGIHWTFDAEQVLKLVKTLHASRTNSSEVILAPSFDHATKDPVASALRIEPETEIIIIEGNWLLLNRDPWKEIASYVDDTWFVDVEPSLARQRVAARHIKSGIEEDWESAVARAEGNDLVNGEEIRTCLVKPSIVVESIEEKTEE
ncbi:P-loop containing nucleoside triphosphate hydrolase protein [Thelonectria olida]|uniref:P-loop containing nucleoside triphosphate hydrolase protein n=1 Tax=Thelonectria olida TaxID=1576542 RepID=A0A9P9AN87_9HYPO|nr:P-loop containing nucleoside triphosphate hydrolase protein [Thelonectria olida]